MLCVQGCYLKRSDESQLRICRVQFYDDTRVTYMTCVSLIFIIN